jgi:hypothetical protein
MKPRLTSGINSTFVLAQTIDLAVRIDVRLLHARRKRFERIYLLEDHEIAFIAPFHRQEGLATTKCIQCAL